MHNIFVTGAKGQVGQELQNLAVQFPHFSFVFYDIEELDLTDAIAVKDFFQKHEFDYCINCAAYTAVDKAEDQPELAQKVNVDAVYHLAQACLLHHISLIQLSTDYVYHNDLNTPLTEDAPTKPQSVYAKSKLQGEEIAKKILPSCTIIRTSWLYSSYGRNFVKTMLNLGQQRTSLNVVFDQIGTPTYARDLASAILSIIDKVENNQISSSALTGIYNFSNEGITSWYDFATSIFELGQIDCKVYPILSSEFPTPAKRPPFSVLDKSKIKSVFDMEIPHWKESLKECMHLLKKKNVSAY